MNRNNLSDEQKKKNKEKKDAVAAARFHIKAAKLVQVINILRKFVLLLLIPYYTCTAISDFRVIGYPCPLAPTRHCSKYVNIYMYRKNLCGSKDML